MSDIRIDHGSPLDITVQFDTQLRINADFLYQRPGDSQWRTFYAAKVSQDVPDQVVRTRLDPMPANTGLLLTAVYSGAKKTSFKAIFSFAQNGVELGTPIRVTGSTGEKFSAFREVEVRLV